MQDSYNEAITKAMLKEIWACIGLTIPQDEPEDMVEPLARELRWGKETNNEILQKLCRRDVSKEPLSMVDNDPNVREYLTNLFAQIPLPTQEIAKIVEEYKDVLNSIEKAKLITQSVIEKLSDPEKKVLWENFHEFEAVMDMKYRAEEVALNILKILNSTAMESTTIDLLQKAVRLLLAKSKIPTLEQTFNLLTTTLDVPTPQSGRYLEALKLLNAINLRKTF